MDKIKHLENKYSQARYDLIKACDGDELKFYLFLKLYAINKHEAFPSYKTIKEHLGWSKGKISKLIQKMVKLEHLKVGKRGKKTKGGKQAGNLYDITWYDKVNDGRGFQKETKGFPKGNTSLFKGVSNSGLEQEESITIINKNQLAEQSSTVKRKDQDIFDLIEMFNPINPSYTKLFGNKTQRGAIERLIKQHGRGKVEWVMNIIPKTNEIKFAPTITTPLQLEDRLGSLIAFLKKEKGQSDKNKIATL